MQSALPAGGASVDPLHILYFGWRRWKTIFATTAVALRRVGLVEHRHPALHGYRADLLEPVSMIRLHGPMQGEK
jgi:hypothetical protein